MARRRADGRWEATAYIKGRRRSFYAATKGEADRKLRKALTDNDRGIPVGDRRISVGRWTDAWLRTMRASARAPKTIESYEWAARWIKKGVLGRRSLAELTVADVEGWLGDCAEGGMAYLSMCQLRTILAMILKQAERQDVLGRNVASLAEVPDGPRSERRSLTEEQAVRLLEVGEGERNWALAVVLLRAGLRSSEALSLTWDCYDGKSLDSRQGKTPAAIRRIVVTGEVRTALARHLKEQKELRIGWGPDWQDNDLIFPNEIGNRLAQSTLRVMLNRMTEKAGLGHWRPHELRHSFVSLALDAGVPEEDVARYVGHASTAVTHEVYRHEVRPSIDIFGGQNGGQTTPIRRRRTR